MMRTAAPMLMLVVASCSPPALRSEEDRFATEARLRNCSAKIDAALAKVSALSARYKALGVLADTLEANANNASKHLEAFDADVAASEGDAIATARVREMELADYGRLHQGYSSLIETLESFAAGPFKPERAVSVLEFLRSSELVRVEDGRRADVLLAQVPLAAGEGLALAQRADAWARAQLGLLQKSEAGRQRAYEAFLKELGGAAAAASRSRLDALAAHARSLQKALDARRDKDAAEKERAAAQRLLEDETRMYREQAAALEAYWARAAEEAAAREAAARQAVVIV